MTASIIRLANQADLKTLYRQNFSLRVSSENVRDTRLGRTGLFYGSRKSLYNVRV